MGGLVGRWVAKYGGRWLSREISGEIRESRRNKVGGGVA
jgi:hypothetical protein